MHNPDEQAIRERAYAIWEAAGRPDGQQNDHWQQAQADLQANAATVPMLPDVLRTPVAAPRRRTRGTGRADAAQAGT